MAGIAAEATHDHQHGIRPLSPCGRAVLKIKAALGILVHAEGVALPFFQHWLVVGIKPVDATGSSSIARAVNIGIRQPAEGALAEGVVVRAKTTTATHDIRAIAILLIGSHADR